MSFLIINFLISLITLFFILPTNASALIFYDQPVPAGANYQVIIPPDPCLNQGPAECANSQNDGNCGLQACSGGQTWSKYELTCIQKRDPETGKLTYDNYYEQGTVVYSIGDKCYAPEEGLHSSSCFGQPSPQQYKTCCSNTSPSYVNPGSCEAYSGDKTNPPYEGQCPLGYRREVSCGPGTGVTCGQAACGPIRTCSFDSTYNQCGQSQPGTCLDNYPADHWVQITKSACSDGTFDYACTGDPGRVAGQCDVPYAPDLIGFNGTSSCYSTPYSAKIDWSGAPFNTSTCGVGFWIDVSTDSNFSSYFHFCATKGSLGTDSSYSITTNGSDFGPSFTFNPSTTYYTRVFNNSPDNGGHSDTVSLNVPASGTCTATVGGKVTAAPGCTTGISGVNISIFDSNLNQTQSFPTDVNGNFSATSFVRGGDGYAVRPPATPPTGYQNPPKNPLTGATSNWYESQVAGGSPDCGKNNSCNFCYTPAVGFSYSLSKPGNVTIQTPSTGSASGQTDVALTLNSGTTQPIGINVSGAIPAGTTTFYTNNGCSPNCSVTLKFTISSSTPAGTYPLTVSGNPVSNNGSQTFNLIVSSQPATTAAIDGTAKYNCATKQYDTTISWTANDTNYHNIFYYNSGPWTSGNDGWTQIWQNQRQPSAGSTSTISPPWSSTAPASGSTHTWAVTDSNNAIQGTRNIFYPAPSCSDICDPANYQHCTTGSIPQGCNTTGITQAQHTYCAQLTATSASICIYCPPQAPSGPTCTNAVPPPNDAPVSPGNTKLVLNPDGHTVTMSYTFSVSDQFRPNIDFYRNSQPGFIQGGTGVSLIGNQIGGYPTWYDPSPPHPTIVYYQIENSNGSNSADSNTVGFYVPQAEYRNSCQYYGYSSTNFVSATQISSSPTSLTFNLVYNSSNAFGCGYSPCTGYNPNYLQINRGSVGTAYIPWGSASSKTSRCISYGYSWQGCLKTQWTASYSIDLPPNTSDNFTVTGFNDGQCGGYGGSVPFSGGTSAGESVPLTSTSISGSVDQDPNGAPYSTINFTPPNEGTAYKVYRVEGWESRWPSSAAVYASKTWTNTQGSQEWTATVTDDLAALPAGTYYYGAQLWQRQWCILAKTNQSGIKWTPPVDAWIKTTGGDVHSNTSITGGGP